LKVENWKDKIFFILCDNQVLLIISIGKTIPKNQKPYPKFQTPCPTKYGEIQKKHLPNTFFGI